MKKKMVLVHPCPKCGSIYLAWQPARRCMYRVRPLQAHGDCLEQGVEEEKCTMMGS